VHALGVGATGGLILGMMTRTARGHTGRPLAADAPEMAIYVLIMLAAVLRVLMPWLVPSLYVSSLVASAAAWSAAFLIYLWQYTPWLVSARPDGKDG
ncbi:MAG: NnrS family protein, partial [Rhodoferax sp.]